MFHKHNWLEVERFYAEPRGFETQGGMSEYMAEKLLFGQTTMLYKCCDLELPLELKELKIFTVGKTQTKLVKGCGLTRQETILGKSLK